MSLRYGYEYRYERDGINDVRCMLTDVSTIDFIRYFYIIYLAVI